jgi:hypothetical protein
MRRSRISCRGAGKAGRGIMLFQNMWLLLGLLAVAIPIVIHLLNRRTARTVQWGAVQFLLDTLINCRRRIMLEEVLLLGVRCLILALIAMALARPFVPPGSHVPYAIVLPLILLAIVLFGVSFAMAQVPRAALSCRVASAVLITLAVLAVRLEKKLNLGRFGSQSGQSIALVIDGSTSMTLAAEGKSNFQRALAEAARLVETAERGTDFSVFLAGPFPVTVVGTPASDRVKVLSAIEGLKPAFGTAQVPAALAAAAAALEQGASPARKIVLITDGQRRGWDVDEPLRWKFLGDTFSKMNPQPDLVLRTLPLPGNFRNAGVAAIEFSREAVGIDREVGIEVRVENTGGEAVTPSELKLKIDEESLTDRTIGQIEPGNSETIRFAYRFKTPGAHTLVARLVVKDDLPADDSCSAVVNVIGNLRVLLIDGNPSARFLDGAAAFAALAMAPGEETVAGAQPAGGVRPAGPGADRFLIEPKIVDVMALRDMGNLNDYSVVVLADVPQLPAKLARDLEAFAQGGGGILVAPGENARRDFYNGWWMANGKRILPGDIGARVVAEAGEERRLAVSALEHRALRTIKEDSRSDLGALAVSAYWQVSEATRDETVSVGARMNNGDVFLSERRVGRGIVMLAACSLDNRGSNLAGRSAFVPLIHELVYYLSNPGRPDLNALPGPDITLRLSARKVSKGREEETPVDVFGPDAGRIKGRIISGSDGAVVRMDGLQRPGLYSIALPDAFKDACREVLSADGSVSFAVAQDIAESRMQPLGAADLDLVRKFARLTQPGTADETRQILSGKTFGKELWRFLALAALLALLIETGLTRWIAVRRRTGEGSEVAFGERSKPSISFRAQMEELLHGD